MTEIPEHLLKRAQAAREKSATPEPAAEPAAESAAPAGDSRIPEALLKRSQAAKASKAGGDAPTAGGGGAVAVAEKVGAVVAAAPAGGGVPVGAGPGGHTQRLLTVVKSGSIQDVKATPVDKVHTWPHLLAAEFVAALACTAFTFIFSVFVNAPLLQLANTNQTPNPSKAPWYFLGLQELLHYYSPLVSGVIIPSLLIAALVVIPYFDINVERAPFWEGATRTKMIGVLGVTALLTALFFFTAAHPVWSLIGTTWLVAALILLPQLLGDRNRVLVWLDTRSLPFWIFTWFLIATVVLTIVGVFFRGPGWAFTLPWRDGIY